MKINAWRPKVFDTMNIRIKNWAIHNIKSQADTEQAECLHLNFSALIMGLNLEKCSIRFFYLCPISNGLSLEDVD